MVWLREKEREGDRDMAVIFCLLQTHVSGLSLIL